ncbi:hypothetical protein BX666DRAFT_2030847 [Dichotomocladium elegans]|nr:hypothetical protein BX666DRAFT_2030847 [Dichotomocladium elegans]
MGVNQSKLSYEASLSSNPSFNRSSTSIRRCRRHQSQQQQQQQQPIYKSDAVAFPEPISLSDCATTNGTANPTSYNDTTKLQQDSGYSSNTGVLLGRSTSFCHAQQLASTITASTELSWYSYSLGSGFSADCPTTYHSTTAISQHSVANTKEPTTAEAIADELLAAPCEQIYEIIHRIFTKARHYDRAAQSIVHQGFVLWNQRLIQNNSINSDDDEGDLRIVAEVCVARCGIEGYDRSQTTKKKKGNGFHTLCSLAENGCWQAFFPLAMCYMEGAPNCGIAVNRTMARQWFSTVAQLNPQQHVGARPVIAQAQLHLGTLLAQEADPQALGWFIKSASLNNPQAQFVAAIHYAVGLQVNVDRQRAKEYLEQSAAQGFLHAEGALGILYVEDQDFDNGLRWLKRAGEKGDPRALFRLGMMYKDGWKSTPADHTRAVGYLRASADLKHPPAQFYMALYYQMGGLGLKPNPYKADRYVREAATAGYTPAQRFLGYLYREGLVVPTSEGCTRSSTSRFNHKKSDKMAFEWFHRAALRGDVYAHILVGQCHEQGRGTSLNIKTALEYYKQAAAHPGPYQAHAQHAVAELLLRTHREEEAFEWFVLASAAANREHQSQQQLSSKMDQEEWLGNYDKYPANRAKLVVARYYIHGWGNVPIDKHKAYDILVELAQASDEDAHAHYWLASCFLEGIPGKCQINLTAAFKHYMIAAKTNNGPLDSEYQVARMYAYGTGTARDRSAALKWYKKAAARGHPGALYTLGAHYYANLTTTDSSNSITRNMKKAIDYFEKAAERDHVDAMARLADIYMREASFPQTITTTIAAEARRAGDRKRNYAIHWYTKAASLGHVAAQRELGKLYHSGIGIPKDYDKAFELFSKASAKDDPAATLLLGNCYEHGHGVVKDQERAIELYLRAGRLGYPNASFATGHLYNELNRIREAYVHYKTAASDVRLNGTPAQKTAKLMIARYVITFIAEDNVFQETEEDAFEMLRKLADDDRFGPAFYWLAHCHHYGIGTLLDINQAIVWYERSANEAQQVEALVQLGNIYGQGEGVPINHVYAFGCFQRAAQKGHPAGYYQLGLAYWRGSHGIQVDATRAANYFRDAAAQGYGPGHWALGQMALENEDHDTALKYWINGSHLGHALSMRSQALLLLAMHNHSTNDDIELKQQQQYLDAIELLEGAAQAGDIESHFYVGRAHISEAAFLKRQYLALIAENPSSTFFDDLTDCNDDDYDDEAVLMLQQHQEKVDLAIHYLERAAMAGHVEAMFLLAQIWHEQGQYAAAHEYYTRAAEAGFLLARVMRARYQLADGLPGIKADPEKGYQELMSCAQDEGCADAYHSLAQCYEHGLGTEQNYRSAIDWYMRSVKATNDAEALCRIGHIHAQGHVQQDQKNNYHKDVEALRWYELACQMSSHPRAHYQVGLYYLHGIQNHQNDSKPFLVLPNMNLAVQHFEAAAHQNDRDAMFELGVLLSDEGYLERAAQLGVVAALREHGRLYHRGVEHSHIPQDLRKSYMLFCQAAELGDREAALYVGTYYEHGIYVVPDLEAAKAWYQTALGEEEDTRWWVAELALARLFHQQGRYDDAYPLLKAAFEHGTTAESRITPEIMMATYTLKGLTDQGGSDLNSAADTLLRYARAGETRVFFEVAQCYEMGRGVQQDRREAFEWYSRLEQFDARLTHDERDMLSEELQRDVSNALLHLARHYYRVTPMNIEKAEELERRATERGFRDKSIHIDIRL